MRGAPDAARPASTVLGFPAGQAIEVFVGASGSAGGDFDRRTWQMTNGFRLRVEPRAPAAPATAPLRVTQEGLGPWRGSRAPAGFIETYAAHAVPVLLVGPDGLLAGIDGALDEVGAALRGSLGSGPDGEAILHAAQNEAALRAAAGGFWNLAALVHARAAGAAPGGTQRLTLPDPLLGPLPVTVEATVSPEAPCLAGAARPLCVEVTLTVTPDRVALAAAERHAAGRLPPGHAVRGYTVVDRARARVQQPEGRLVQLWLTRESTIRAEGPAAAPVVLRDRELREYRFRSAGESN